VVFACVDIHDGVQLQKVTNVGDSGSVNPFNLWIVDRFQGKKTYHFVISVNYPFNYLTILIDLCIVTLPLPTYTYYLNYLN
jgi:hypothetical protein